jgi:hypothetical protein
MFVLTWLASGLARAEGPDWSGYLSLEPRVFVNEPLFAGQPDAGVSPSLVLAPELRYEWNRGDDRVTLAPFIRWDADDDERTHADLREALWLHVDGAWTWQLGVGRVFWGVTESRHLVDIVNQTDLVDDVDEEDKLGQPMVAVERWTRKAGSFGVFLLPGFRERSYPAANARLRGTLPVDTERAEYESGAKNRHLDWALRWSHAIGNWDLGLSGFYGTSREPRLLPEPDSSMAAVLIPRYELIGQLGIDLQYTKASWLWKLEAIGRQGQGKAFGAVVAGFEHTFFSLGESGADLGLLAEYLYDGRDDQAPATIYDDDWFAGFRLSFNDTEDTTILGGAIFDSNGTFAIVEAERRIGDAWKFEAEVRWFLDVDENDPLLGGIRRDSFITLRLARYL